MTHSRNKESVLKKLLFWFTHASMEEFFKHSRDFKATLKKFDISFEEFNTALKRYGYPERLRRNIKEYREIQKNIKEYQKIQEELLKKNGMERGD